MNLLFVLAIMIFGASSCTLPTIIDPATYIVTMPTAYIFETTNAPPTFSLTWIPQATSTKIIRTPMPPPTRRATITPFDTPVPGPTIKAPVGGYKSQEEANCYHYDYSTYTYKFNVVSIKNYYNAQINLYEKLIQIDIRYNGALGSLARDRAQLKAYKNALTRDLNKLRKDWEAIVPAVCRY